MKFRLAAILLTFSATVAVVGRIWLAPRLLERPPAPVILPEESLVAGWEAVPVEPNDETLPNTRRFHAPRSNLDLELQFIPNLPEHYVRNPRLAMRFLPHGHLPLDAGLHYYVNSRTMVITNLDTNLPIQALVESRETSPRVAHGLWSAGQRLHLSTIITPGGETAMATRRVARSMYLDPLTPGRLWDWMRGRTAIPDRRCVLVHFSIPAPPEATHRPLEEAWTEWQRAFRPEFPAS